VRRGEDWNDGKMEKWNIGILEKWKDGIMDSCCCSGYGLKTLSGLATLTGWGGGKVIIVGMME
jgi:hypothetical protein